MSDQPKRPVIEHDGSVKGILIATPAYGQYMTAHTGGVLYSIAQMLTAGGIANQFLWFSMADVVEARNVFLTLWYDHHPQFSHLLMVDNDMHFSPFLIREMIKFGKPLTGVFYSRREVPADGNIAQIMIGHTLPGEQELEDGFLKCRRVGAGILLISRDIVTRILKAHPEINDLAEVGKLAQTGITRVIRAFDK
ncbi:MAG: hypothetical protein ACJ8E5_08215, partial [Xanthobacteraceae bacterium]